MAKKNFDTQKIALKTDFLGGQITANNSYTFVNRDEETVPVKAAIKVQFPGQRYPIKVPASFLDRLLKLMDNEDFRKVLEEVRSQEAQ